MMQSPQKRTKKSSKKLKNPLLSLALAARRNKSDGSVFSWSSKRSRRNKKRESTRVSTKDGVSSLEFGSSLDFRGSLQDPDTSDSTRFSSESIQRLSFPLEIDLDDIDPGDENSGNDDDDKDDSNFFESTCFDDAKSVGSRSAASRKSILSSRSRSRRFSRRQSDDGVSVISRQSFQSRHSLQSRRSIRGIDDDGISVVSKQSLQTTSVSIMSLPREIGLLDVNDDDHNEDSNQKAEDENKCTKNKDLTSHFDDAKSVGSRSASSRVSRPSLLSSPTSLHEGSSRSLGSSMSGASRYVRRRSRSRRASLAEDSFDFDPPVLTVYVEEKQIVDHYGEKGLYTGAFSQSTGMPNGKGCLEYENEGKWYEGDWNNGHWNGFGRLRNRYGDIYNGWFKNDHKHGTGILEFASGRVFEGEHVRDEMIHGKMTYEDGSVYVGPWVGGMRHGKGKCVFVDGSKYEGDFRRGKFHGQGTMTWDDGAVYVGNWKDDKMDGRGKEIRPDGTLRHDGEWSRGKPIRRKLKIIKTKVECMD